jgi:hypothetical protein
MKQNEILFLNEKLVSLYINLEKESLFQCSIIAGLTYSHAYNVTKIWEKLGLLYMNKSGRRYNIIFTAYGKRLQYYLCETVRVLQDGNVQFAALKEKERKE